LRGAAPRRGNLADRWPIGRVHTPPPRSPTRFRDKSAAGSPLPIAPPGDRFCPQAVIRPSAGTDRTAQRRISADIVEKVAARKIATDLSNNDSRPLA